MELGRMAKVGMEMHAALRRKGVIDSDDIEEELLRREEMAPISLKIRDLTTGQDSVVKAFGFQTVGQLVIKRCGVKRMLLRVVYDEDEVPPPQWVTLRLEELDPPIEELSLLSVEYRSITAKEQWRSVCEEILTLNPDADALLVEQAASYNLDETLRSCLLPGLGLTQLPSSIGDLALSGELDLSRNELRTLPEALVQCEVGGALRLNDNRLEALPEGFHTDMEVGGLVDLSRNALSEWPHRHGVSSLTVGGDLLMEGNSPTLEEQVGKVSFPNVEGRVKIKAGGEAGRCRGLDSDHRDSGGETMDGPAYDSEEEEAEEEEEGPLATTTAPAPPPPPTALLL